MERSGQNSGQGFPTTKLHTLPVAAKDDVQISVAIDVVSHAASFDWKVIFLDRVGFPAGSSPAIPNEGGSLLAEADDKIFDSVAIKIAHQRARLFSRTSGRRQLAALAGKVCPDGIFRCLGLSGGRRKDRDGDKN